jgi:hypothetical protein
MISFPSLPRSTLRWSNLWRCLADDAHSISVATAMLLTSTHLYLTGNAGVSRCTYVVLDDASCVRAFHTRLRFKCACFIVDPLYP